jgi:hypothetical protein
MRATKTTRALAILATGMLAGAPAALADPPVGQGKPQNPGSQGKGHAKGKGKAKGVTYVFKGTYAGGEAVEVKHGNAHVKRAGLIGETVTFDLASAAVVVSDANSDGKSDLSDVAAGDKVVVKSRMPRKQPAVQPFPARQLVDQTRPPA